MARLISFVVLLIVVLGVGYSTACVGRNKRCGSDDDCCGTLYCQGGGPYALCSPCKNDHEDCAAGQKCCNSSSQCRWLTSSNRRTCR
ncbi:hypothetical protein Bhyg_03757 [Pseudolycoriella hygida]|uniref:Uncharacterized protein n=1 Tax=Pseudolycoriella hygida TaxID=35572 RepID=A0A9Q0NDY9_9DIPT|nr:hypothetical protein Bhyg_03757 [Pseudolycoriella hygida]